MSNSIGPLRRIGDAAGISPQRAASARAIAPITGFAVDVIDPLISAARPLRGLGPLLPMPSASTAAISVSAASTLPRGIPSAEQICDVAQAMLASAADARDQSPARFAADAPIISGDRLPSCNSADAQGLLWTDLLSRDDGGELCSLDLHLARSKESGWEATAFDSDARAGGHAFPYRDPPMLCVPLQFDFRSGAFTPPKVGTMLMVVPAGVAVPRRMHPGLALALTSVGAMTTAAVLFGMMSR